jgi:hypothetical protein
MLTGARAGLAALLVLVSASEAWAQSQKRATHRAPAPRSTAPAYYQSNAPAKPAVRPFTAEEKGWFDRASKVY